MNTKEKNFISAVIYVRNCADTISDFVLNIANVLAAHFEHGEIICVNDASTDDSANVIRSLGNSATHISISLLNLNRFHAKEAAMQGGVNLAVGDFVFEFDETDCTICGDDIMSIYRKALEGYDIVSASTTPRQASSRHFYKLFNAAAGLPYDLHTEIFRLLSRRAINRIGSLNKVISYRKVAYAGCGLRCLSVPFDGVHFSPKKPSRLERKYRNQLAADSIIMFTGLGFRISLILTIAMMAVMIFTVVYALVSRFALQTTPGWTSTVIIVSFGFFGLFGILSIIIKYLQLLMDISVKKTSLTFESIEKITRGE